MSNVSPEHGSFPPDPKPTQEAITEEVIGAERIRCETLGRSGARACGLGMGKNGIRCENFSCADPDRARTIAGLLVQSRLGGALSIVEQTSPGQSGSGVADE